MGKIRVSVVKYINSYPFIYGLNKKLPPESFELITSHPAECARQLAEGTVDIGLVPVASIHMINHPHIISDYCIGADGVVKTVLLVSNVPLSDIETIWLDFRSMTSVQLVKVLANNYWNCKPEWQETNENFNLESMGKYDGAVLIGDQCFTLPTIYRYKYDLAEEWKKFSRLPFVFACWVANRQLPDDFSKIFNSALQYGVSNIEAAVDSIRPPAGIERDEILDYLYNNIEYSLNDDKRRAMKLFLSYL